LISITFAEAVTDPGTFNWLLAFRNGRFGVFTATKQGPAPPLCGGGAPDAREDQGGDG
jgi:hypothetical protein